MLNPYAILPALTVPSYSQDLMNVSLLCGAGISGIGAAAASMVPRLQRMMFIVEY